jgi:uridine phosphorylase
MNSKDTTRLSELYLSDLSGSLKAAIAIVPGDPDRVETVAELLSGVIFFTLRRGYRAVSGKYKGTPVYVVSTGVGGASLEHIVVELKELGVETLIRVGTTGALQQKVRVGDLVVNDGAVRLDGTSANYARLEYPAAASWEVVSALVDAASGTNLNFHVGIGATTSSFFAGQSRETISGWSSSRSNAILNEMCELGVLNFEMEAGTLFTLARLFQMRAGAVCAVVNNRLSGEMGGSESVKIACRIALEAASALDVHQSAAIDTSAKNMAS